MKTPRAYGPRCLLQVNNRAYQFLGFITISEKVKLSFQELFSLLHYFIETEPWFKMQNRYSAFLFSPERGEVVKIALFRFDIGRIN